MQVENRGSGEEYLEEAPVAWETWTLFPTEKGPAADQCQGLFFLLWFLAWGFLGGGRALKRGYSSRESEGIESQPSTWQRERSRHRSWPPRQKRLNK